MLYVIYVYCMPNKTLYVRDEDVPVWEKAEKLAAPEGVSPLVSKLLRQYVGGNEVDLNGMQRLTVRVRENEAAPTALKAFRGRWLWSPAQPIDVGPDEYAVALTGRGQLALYGWNPNSELSRLTLYRNFEDMKIGRRANLAYDFYDDREVDTPPPPVLAAVAESLNKRYEEELDI